MINLHVSSDAPSATKTSPRASALTVGKDNYMYTNQTSLRLYHQGIVRSWRVYRPVHVLHINAILEQAFD